MGAQHEGFRPRLRPMPTPDPYTPSLDKDGHRRDQLAMTVKEGALFVAVHSRATQDPHLLLKVAALVIIYHYSRVVKLSFLPCLKGRH